MTEHRVFVTAPADGKILRVDAKVNEDTRVRTDLKVTLVAKLKGGASPTDINFGPDGNLYVIDRDQILKQSGKKFVTFYTPINSGDPTGLGVMRFRGEEIGKTALYFTASGPNTSNGIWRFSDFTDPTSLEQVIERDLDPARGLTVGLLGRLIAVDGPDLVRVSRNSTTNDFKNGTPEDLNLGGFFSSASAWGVATDAPKNRKVVTGSLPASGGDAIAVFTCGSSCSVEQSEPLDAGDLARDVEISLQGDQALDPNSPGSPIFATTNAGGDGGKVWRWDPEASFNKLIPLADLGLEKGKANAKSAWGIALPPTTRTGEVTVAASPDIQTVQFNCGSSILDVSFIYQGLAPKRLREVCRQELPEDVNEELKDSVDCSGLCTQYDWANGFCTVHDTAFLPNDNNITDESISFTYGRDREAFDALDPGVCADFEREVITDYHSFGVLDITEDANKGCRRCSEDVLTDQANDNPAAFDGFFPHIEQCGPNPTTGPVTIVTGNGLPLRVAFDPISPEAELQLSITCFDGEGGLVYHFADSVGNANVDNLFRFSVDKHVYNLDLKASTDLEGNPIPIGKVCALDIWGDAGFFVSACIERK